LAFVAEFGTQNFNLKTKIDMENKTSTKHENGNDANRLCVPVFDSFPLFYCQHKDAQWNCKHYKVVDKDFYSIETKCRFLGIDNETCNSKPCNADACRQFLNVC
jgi:hypothetical protein